MPNPIMRLINKIKIMTGLNFGIGYLTLSKVVGTVVLSLLCLTLASILTVEEYGKISYLLAISLFGVTFSVFGLRITMVTYVAKGITEIKNQINSLVLISAISFAVATLFLFQSISIFVIIITMPFFMMSTGECLANKKYKEFSILEIGTRSTQVILTLIFYNIGGIEFALIGYGLAYVPFSYRYFSSLRFFKFKFDLVRSRFRFSLHSFFLQLGRNIQWYDKFLIAPWFGFFVLGQYQIGIQFLLFVGMIPQILFQYLLPENATGVSHTRIRYTGFILTIIFVVIILMAMPLILSNFFQKYVESIFAIQIILIGAIPLTINSILGAKFLGMGKSHFAFYGVLIYVGVQTASIVTLGFAYSTVGLAISLVLALSSQASFLLLMDLLEKNNVNEKI